MTSKSKQNKQKRYQILPNVFIYQRDRSKYWYGYLKLNGKQYRKSLGTTNRSDAERFVVEWKQDFLTSPDTAPSLPQHSFRVCADEYLEFLKMKSRPVRSGQTQYEKKRSVVFSPSSNYGLIHEFADMDIRSIGNEQVNKYVARLVRDNLSNNRITDYLDVLRQIILNKNEIPNFNVKVSGGEKSTQRGFLNLGNYRKVRNACKKYRGKKMELSRTKSIVIDDDLDALVVFLTGTMLRPTLKECFSIKKKDIQIRKNKKGLEYLIVQVERKVRTTQGVTSLNTSVGAFRELNKRHKFKSDDYIFAPHIKNRNRVMRYFQDMFRVVLREINLEVDHHGNKLTLYSLRHTAIIMNVKAQKVPMIEIARQADTSLQMIDNFYYPRIGDIDQQFADDFVR
jgi:integrase